MLLIAAANGIYEIDSYAKCLTKIAAERDASIPLSSFVCPYFV